MKERAAELGAGLAPFASVLLRTESVSSSMIENVSASARSVAMAELGDTSKRNATLVVDNVAAMSAALAAADDTTAESILAMHRALMAHSDPDQAGHWRQEPVWIGTSATSPVGADYLAPRFERVPELIEDLAGFVRRNDIQVLAHAMLAHAQFETIHPFTDGNGRTGRALIQAILRGKGLTRNVTVPISAGLLVDVRAYTGHWMPTGRASRTRSYGWEQRPRSGPSRTGGVWQPTSPRPARAGTGRSPPGPTTPSGRSWICWSASRW